MSQTCNLRLKGRLILLLLFLCHFLENKMLIQCQICTAYFFCNSGFLLPLITLLAINFIWNIFFSIHESLCLKTRKIVSSWSLNKISLPLSALKFLLHWYF